MQDGAIEKALARVLANPRFSRTQRQARLLRYIVERSLAGRRDDLKEYAIAHEVFDRNPSYDPKVDSTVRVEVAKLRARLSAYYEADGATDEIRIEIPKGGYIAEFVPQAAAQEDREPPSRRWFLAVPAEAAALGGVFLWRQSREVPDTAAVLESAEPANRGGGSAEASRLLVELAHHLKDSRFRIAGGADEPAKTMVRIHAGRSWFNPGRLVLVAQVNDEESACAVSSHSWETGASSTSRIAEQAARRIAETCSGHADRPPDRQARTRALEVYRQAVRRLNARAKSCILKNAVEKLQNAPLTDLLKTARLLEEALRLDASLAVARAKLAWVYHEASEYDPGLKKKVRDTAMAALADGASPDANFVLGYLAFFTDWDIPGAMRHFAACQDQAAFSFEATRFHTNFSCIRAVPEKALERLGRLLSVQPRSAPLRAAAFIVARQAGDFDEMERIAQETIGWGEAVSYGRWQLGTMYLESGRSVQAEEQFRSALKQDPGSVRATFALSRARAARGFLVEARELLSGTGIDRRDPSLAALLELEHGDGRRATRWLEEAIRIREVSLPYMALEPLVRRLKGTPAMAAFFKHVRLEEA